MYSGDWNLECHMVSHSILQTYITTPCGPDFRQGKQKMSSLWTRAPQHSLSPRFHVIVNWSSLVFVADMWQTSTLHIHQTEYRAVLCHSRQYTRLWWKATVAKRARVFLTLITTAHWTLRIGPFWLYTCCTAAATRILLTQFSYIEIRFFFCAALSFNISCSAFLLKKLQWYFTLWTWIMHNCMGAIPFLCTACRMFYQCFDSVYKVAAKFCYAKNSHNSSTNEQNEASFILFERLFNSV